MGARCQASRRGEGRCCRCQEPASSTRRGPAAPMEVFLWLALVLFLLLYPHVICSPPREPRAVESRGLAGRLTDTVVSAGDAIFVYTLIVTTSLVNLVSTLYKGRTRDAGDANGSLKNVRQLLSSVVSRGPAPSDSQVQLLWALNDTPLGYAGDAALPDASCQQAGRKRWTTYLQYLNTGLKQAKQGRVFESSPVLPLDSKPPKAVGAFTNHTVPVTEPSAKMADRIYTHGDDPKTPRNSPPAKLTETKTSNLPEPAEKPAAKTVAQQIGDSDATQLAGKKKLKVPVPKPRVVIRNPSARQFTSTATQTVPEEQKSIVTQTVPEQHVTTATQTLPYRLAKPPRSSVATQTVPEQHVTIATQTLPYRLAKPPRSSVATQTVPEQHTSTATQTVPQQHTSTATQTTPDQHTVIHTASKRPPIPQHTSIFTPTIPKQHTSIITTTIHKQHTSIATQAQPTYASTGTQTDCAEEVATPQYTGIIPQIVLEQLTAPPRIDIATQTTSEQPTTPPRTDIATQAQPTYASTGTQTDCAEEVATPQYTGIIPQIVLEQLTAPPRIDIVTQTTSEQPTTPPRTDIATQTTSEHSITPEHTGIATQTIPEQHTTPDRIAIATKITLDQSTTPQRTDIATKTTPEKHITPQSTGISTKTILKPQASFATLQQPMYACTSTQTIANISRTLLPAPKLFPTPHHARITTDDVTDSCDIGVQVKLETKPDCRVVDRVKMLECRLRLADIRNQNWCKRMANAEDLVHNLQSQVCSLNTALCDLKTQHTHPEPHPEPPTQPRLELSTKTKPEAQPAFRPEDLPMMKPDPLSVMKLEHLSLGHAPVFSKGLSALIKQLREEMETQLEEAGQKYRESESSFGSIVTKDSSVLSSTLPSAKSTRQDSDKTVGKSFKSYGSADPSSTEYETSTESLARYDTPPVRHESAESKAAEDEPESDEAPSPGGTGDAAPPCTPCTPCTACIPFTFVSSLDNISCSSSDEDLNRQGGFVVVKASSSSTTRRLQTGPIKVLNLDAPSTNYILTCYEEECAAHIHF